MVQYPRSEEATARYYALSWEVGEIERKYHELKTAEGKVFEDAKRFFPNGKEWKAWLKSHKTCPVTGNTLRAALYHVGYRLDGSHSPENIMTKFVRLTDEILEDDPRYLQFEAALKRLVEEFSS